MEVQWKIGHYNTYKTLTIALSRGPPPRCFWSWNLPIEFIGISTPAYIALWLYVLSNISRWTRSLHSKLSSQLQPPPTMALSPSTMSSIILLYLWTQRQVVETPSPSALFHSVCVRSVQASTVINADYISVFLLGKQSPSNGHSHMILSWHSSSWLPTSSTLLRILIDSVSNYRPLAPPQRTDELSVFLHNYMVTLTVDLICLCVPAALYFYYFSPTFTTPCLHYVSLRYPFPFLLAFRLHWWPALSIYLYYLCTVCM